MQNADRIPVIAGIGEVKDRDRGLEPRALMLEAIREASASSPTLLSRVDSIDVINVASFRYDGIARLLAADIGVEPDRVLESTVGGEKPVRLLVEAAERIARGESTVALVCGGEAMRTRASLKQAGLELGWGPSDPNARPSSSLDYVTPQAAQYGLTHPTNVYPLYENASRHAWHQTASDADNENAELWSRLSRVAAENPFAWIQRSYSPGAIASAEDGNRLIAFPYRKLMVANPMVNQAAAILLTSLAVALRSGIPEQELVFVRNGARADEPKDFLKRDRFDRSAAQDAVLTATLNDNELGIEDVDLWELYSCFPIVPKLARRSLGLPADTIPSVAGGLTFFGAPANNYMTHAITAAVRQLRKGAGNALLYGQGEFVTKHAAVVLTASAPPSAPQMRDLQVQAESAMEPVPPLVEAYEGEASLETFTIVYDRQGAPLSAPVILRTQDGKRTVALGSLVTGTVNRLADRSQDPIGSKGNVAMSATGTFEFSLSETD